MPMGLAAGGGGEGGQPASTVGWRATRREWASKPIQTRSHPKSQSRQPRVPGRLVVTPVQEQHGHGPLDEEGHRVGDRAYNADSAATMKAARLRLALPFRDACPPRTDHPH